MRSLISGAAALACLLGAAGSGRAAAVTDLWPAQPPAATDAAALAQRAAVLEAARPTLPPELAPAVQFQTVFYRVLGSAPASEWVPAMHQLMGAAAADPVTAAVRDLAKAWFARAQMQAIDKVLDDYYVQNVRFPASLTEVENELPKELRTDPWGEPWTYHLRAPAGLPNETAQRYQLGPTRFPALGTLKEATVDRQPFVRPSWQIVLRVVGENRALEFHSGAATIGLIQAGGKIDNCTLAYVGDRWALMAAPDQLFTVVF